MAKSSVLKLRFLTGDKPRLTLDDEFLRNHTKVLLMSDALERPWEVKLDGNRLSGGWQEFAAVHDFTDGDVLLFRHDGDEIFHVAVSGSRSSSSDIQHSISSSSTDTDDSESDDVDDDAGDILMKKNKKAEAESCFIRARVTRCNLKKDRLDLPRDFNVKSCNKYNKTSEIDLANKKGSKWAVRLSRNTSSGVFYIRRGWAHFCSDNGLSEGDICSFKLSENGERPVLLLCSHESGNGHEVKEEEEEEYSEADAMKTCSVGGCSKEKRISKGKEKQTHSRFLTVDYTPSRFKNGQLYVSASFWRESGGIMKSGEITLVDNDGRKWPSYLHRTGHRVWEWFYIRKGWKEMCKANGVEVNDSFMLELIWEDTNPIFKFHSKIENKMKGKIITSKKRAIPARPVEKTPGVEIDGQRGSKRRKLQRTQPESCSVSDQVANVKQSIQDTLITVRRFLAELKTREKNLEASLLKVDALGEKILGISKILN